MYSKKKSEKIKDLRKKLEETIGESLEKRNGPGKGPGSRGGEVIGRTKRGNPIYARASSGKHREFSPEEHQQAMNEHQKIAEDTAEKVAKLREKGQEIPRKIYEFIQHHREQAKIHQHRMTRKERSYKSAYAEDVQDLFKGTDEPPFYSAVVVTNPEKTHFLIGKRKKDSIYTSPGGGANLGETPRETAVREAFEEANIRLSPGRLKELGVANLKNGKVCHKFLAVLREDQKASTVHDPDKEVWTWIWQPIDKPLPDGMDEQRKQTFVDAKMKINGLKKAEIRDLRKSLEKGKKGFPVGTVRKWGGRKYVKHQDGWVAIGGEHHGKLMGNFSGEATHSDHADEYQNEKALNELENVSENASTPRESAKENTESKKEEYVNARDSKFSNMGEDIKGSARHKAMEWKGLEQAEKDGVAEKLVKRDKLLKNEPTSFMEDLSESNPINPLVGHLALKKFPPQPPKSNDPKKAREEYLNAFNQMREKAKEVSSNPNLDPQQAINELRQESVSIINNLRENDKKNKVANSLVDYTNKTLSPSAARSKTGVASDLNNFISKARKNYGEGENSYAQTIKKEEVQETAKDVMEGKPIEKAFGEEKKGKKEFKNSELYLNEAYRKGPNTGLDSKEKQENYIEETLKMRGVQWGNSVTDEERSHHLKHTAEAFKDLTDVLDLPEEMGSFNGRLGLAVGARGKGTALAHYEPQDDVINLTRKGGVGSLAHEWGHFFDKTLSDTHGKEKEFISEDFGASSSEVQDAMRSLVGSEAWDDYKKEVREGIKEHAQQGYKMNPQYWMSTREMFARAFEKYVDYKLEQNDRKNTYLSGVKDNKLWGSDETVEKLASHFDNLFKTFKNSEHLNKAIASSEVAHVDINTAEQSMDELAADEGWVNWLEKETRALIYGEAPVELELNKYYKLKIAKVDDGLFDAWVLNSAYGSTQYHDVLQQMNKMTLESIIQTLKAKNFIDDWHECDENCPEHGNKEEQEENEEEEKEEEDEEKVSLETLRQMSDILAGKDKREEQYKAEWQHEDAAKYRDKLIQHLGNPHQSTDSMVLWKNVLGFDKVWVQDESIPHGHPKQHYDFCYAQKNLSLSEDDHDLVIHASESILVDRLKSTVTARCGDMLANAITMGFVERVTGVDAFNEFPQKIEEVESITKDNIQEKYDQAILDEELPPWYKDELGEASNSDESA